MRSRGDSKSASEQLTPRQVAAAIGVSEASMKRWCDKGLLPSKKTAGGHRRLQISDVLKFIRTGGHMLVRPEILGLPSTTGRGDSTVERARTRLAEALEAGDEERVLRLTLDLYLAGHSACEICDKVIAPAFQEIGSRWEHGQIEIYQERRAGEVCRDLLVRLRDVIPKVSAGAPLAIGCTLAGDPYCLATAMVSLVLREIGWRAESYGVGVPVESMMAAVRDVGPRMVWVSVCHVEDEDRFIREYSKLYQFAAARGIAVVVGGRVLNDSLRRQIEYSAFCDSFCHMSAFAKSMNHVAPEPA